jgi:hypothetical protein
LVCGQEKWPAVPWTPPPGYYATTFESPFTLPTDLYILVLFLSFTVGIILASALGIYLVAYCEPCIVEPEETVEERNARGVAMEVGHRHATEQVQENEHPARTENKLPDPVIRGGGTPKLARSELAGGQSKTDPPPQENDEPPSVEEEQRALATFLRRVSLASLTKQEQFEHTNAHSNAQAILKAGKQQSARLQVIVEQRRTRRSNKANKWRSRNGE